MKYKNKGGQPREKAMVAAFALVKNFGATQANVATVMGCSQGTIANWVKEMSYKKEINGLQNELNLAKEYTQELASKMNLIEFAVDSCTFTTTIIDGVDESGLEFSATTCTTTCMYSNNGEQK